MADWNVGVGKAVTPAFAPSGADGGNYQILVQPAGPFVMTITAKPLHITGITASNQVYNNTPVVNTINTAGAMFAAGEVITGDVVAFNGAVLYPWFVIPPYTACVPSGVGFVAGTLDDTGATGKTVVICGYTLSGADAANYSLVDPTTTANITKKPITLSPTDKGLIPQNKPYDGNNNVLNPWNIALPMDLVLADGELAATGTGAWPTPWGPWADDLELGIGASGVGATFASASVGTWAVTATDFVIATHTADYSLVAQPAPLPNASITKATPNLVMFPPTIVQYNATPWNADLRATNPVSGAPVAGSFGTVTYNGSATPPTNVGVYAVVSSGFTPTDTANYNSVAGPIAMGNLTIVQANTYPVITNSGTPWNNAPQAAALEARANLPPTVVVPGVFSNIRYNGSAIVPTEVGTYWITATFVPTDTTNFIGFAGGLGNFVIAKATPVLTVTNSPVTYNGAGQAATVSANVAGVVSGTLTGGAATQTNAGTYAVTANFVPTDTVHYNSLTGAAAGNFIINKKDPTATLAVTNSPVAYDGDPHAATVGITTSSVPGAVANIFTGGELFQTSIGTYPVTADFFPTDAANYNTLTGLSAGNFVIAHVDAELVVNGGFNLYSGTSMIPSDWGATKFAATDGKSNTRKEGLYSVRIQGATGQRKMLTQEILTSGSAGDHLTLKYWIKGQAIPTAGVCTVQVRLYNGSTLVQTKTVACATGTFSWMSKAASIDAFGAYTKAVIKITYFKASGYVWFDGVSFVK
jgi:hypothetical protein